MPPKPLPTQLFKYGKWAHSEELIRWGKIRVGTLFDYKNIEHHGLGIGEREEGEKRLFDTTGADTGETLTGFSARIAARVIGPGFVGPEASTIGFFNSMYVERHRSQNFWLYCTSERLSFRVMDSFEANYDTCVRIGYVWEFFVAIAHELTRRGLIYGGCIIPCTYRERFVHYREDDGLAPVALKAPKYAMQQEVRFVYFPTYEIAVTHIDLTIPWLKPFCEPAKDIPG